MNIQGMEYVIALSKTLNFTKAAAAMYTTQPAFSRVILSVEEELGFPIFERSRRHVRLTRAGEVLLPELEEALRRYTEGVRRAQTLGEASAGKLVIGYIPDTINQDIALLCEDYARRQTNVRVELRETHYYELMSALPAGELDLVVYTTMQTRFPAEYASHPLFESPLCAIVHESNPLAGRDVISPRELKGESFIVLAHDITLSGSWSFVHRFASAHHFTPRIAEQATMLSSAIFQVSCNKGIAIASQFVSYLAPDNVRLVRIEDSEPCVRYALWWRDRKNPALAPFIDCIRTRFPI